MSSPYQSYDQYDAPRDMFVADAQLSERLGFLRRVYGHVFGRQKTLNRKLSI